MAKTPLPPAPGNHPEDLRHVGGVDPTKFRMTRTKLPIAGNWGSRSPGLPGAPGMGKLKEHANNTGQEHNQQKPKTNLRKTREKHWARW